MGHFSNLNKDNKELKILTEYVRLTDKWNKHLNNHNSDEPIIGHVHETNSFFYADTFCSGIRYNLNPKKNWTTDVMYNNNNIHKTNWLGPTNCFNYNFKNNL